jgi:hypothetical protein
MPSFKDSKNPALNPLLAVKKEVVRRQKEANKIGDIVPTPVVSQQTLSPSKGVGLAGVLNEIDSLAEELYLSASQYLESGVNAVRQQRDIAEGLRRMEDEPEIREDVERAEKNKDLVPKPTEVIKDLASDATTLVNLTRRASALLASSFYDLRGLSPIELETCISSAKKINSVARNIAREIGGPVEVGRTVRRLLREPDIPLVARTQLVELNESLNRLIVRWLSPLMSFVDDLSRALTRARQGVSATATGAGYSGGLMPSHFAETSPSLPRRFI